MHFGMSKAGSKQQYVFHPSHLISVKLTECVDAPQINPDLILHFEGKQWDRLGLILILFFKLLFILFYFVLS